MEFSGYNRKGQIRVGYIGTKSLKYKKIRNTACILKASKPLRNFRIFHFVSNVVPTSTAFASCPVSYPKNLSTATPATPPPPPLTPKPQKRQIPSTVEEKNVSKTLEPARATNHPAMSTIKFIAPPQFAKLAKSGFNVVVRIQLNNKEIFSSTRAQKQS